jgi:hypothetical protein
MDADNYKQDRNKPGLIAGLRIRQPGLGAGDKAVADGSAKRKYG